MSIRVRLARIEAKVDVSAEPLYSWVDFLLAADGKQELTPSGTGQPMRVWDAMFKKLNQSRRDRVKD
jgi:hypothetical protein